jgi:uncharacterized membrane protein
MAMIKTAICVSLLFFSQLGFAGESKDLDKLYCVFTEPFFNITFDPSDQSVTYLGVENYDEASDSFIPEIIAQNGQLIKVSTGSEWGDYPQYGSTFELRGDQGEVILRLTFDLQGSDGMSDSSYPFSATYGDEQWILFGGCYTDSAQPYNLYEIFERLGLLNF